MSDQVESVAPAERGATTIADRVVAKVAAQAAREALHHAWRDPDAAHGARAVPRGHDCAPHASALVRRPPEGSSATGSARVRVAVELGYPSDIGGQCRAVRRHVATTVKRLVGMEVLEVAVDVERLHSAPLSRAESGRVR